MPERILVVHNDPDIARFVEVNLRSAGYDVSVASDGEEALDKAGTLRPDLVLLDVMMPRIDGFEAARRRCATSRRSQGYPATSGSRRRSSAWCARTSRSPSCTRTWTTSRRTTTRRVSCAATA